MADSTLDSELFILQNNWGMNALRVGNVPPGGLTDARHHNVAAPYFDPGTVCLVRNPNATAGKPGMAALIYLQVGTQNADSVIAVKSAVVLDSATVWYQVTNDPDSCIAIPSGLGAFALSAMTDAYYGWFWCGGICPEGLLSTLGGNYATNGSLAAGHISFTDLAADYAGLGPYATTTGYAGFALAADA